MSKSSQESSPITQWCRQGHLLDEANTYVLPNTKYKTCRECKRESSKRYRLAHPEVTKAAQSNWRSKALFGGLRETIIQRDGEQCVKCGMTRQQHRDQFGSDITVDHIDGKGVYTPTEEKNNDPSNLQTLCRTCHGLKDTWRKSLKLTEADVVEIHRLLGTGLYQKVVAAKFGVKIKHIHYINVGKAWGYVKKRIEAEK